VHDDRDALAAQCAVGQAVTRELAQDRRVARDPVDPQITVVGQPEVGDPGPSRDVGDGLPEFSLKPDSFPPRTAASASAGSAPRSAGIVDRVLAVKAKLV
jgi:hypothetical protein